MKTKNILVQIIDRLHYLILLFAIIAFNISGISSAAKILIAISAVYIIIFELYMFLKNRDTKQLSDTIISILNMTSQKRLIEFPIPILITDNTGVLLWYNEKFVGEVGADTVNRVSSVFQLNSSILTEKQTKIFLGGKHFTVYPDCSTINDHEMYVLYFIDETEYRSLLKKYNMQKPVVSIILLDNYDELFQNSKDRDRSSATALIDSTLTEWAQSVGGLLTKMEKDRYLFLFKNEDLSSFIEKRFIILDKIRALPVSSTSFPTISIGIGIGNDDFSDNEEFSRIALEMALSRGGDQAVIKTQSGFEFFGGRTKGVEKRTKVKSRVVASSFTELLKNVDNVLVMGHKYSDFDSLGACVGIARISLEAGKNTGIIFDKTSSLANSLYDRLMKSPDISSIFIDPEKALVMAGPNCLLVVVDTHRASYTVMPSILKYAGKIMVIDHHRKAADFIEKTDIFYHEPYASSSCEMVAELMQYMNINRMPSLESEALLSGIYLDTKSFTIRTSLHTFEASSFLRKLGANTVNVKQLFQTDMQTYQLRADIIKNAEIYKKIAAIAIWETDTTPHVRLACAQAADELLNIEGVMASFTLFREKDNSVNISGRSYGQINVQLVLEKLKGGGHQTMAGAQVEDVSPQKAKELLLKAFDEYLEEIRDT